MARVVGEVQLMNRLHAVGGQGEMGIIKKVAAWTRGQMVRNMPRKTGLTAASLQPRILSASKAVIVGSPVAVWIDTGTGLYGPAHRRITPRAARALAFTVGGRRLSGRGGGSLVIVASVAGMKPRPFINRSIAEASQKVGQQISSQIITAWNEAK